MNIIIREYNPSDKNEVYKINEKSLEISFKSLYDIFHRNHPDLFLVAEDTISNEIIGFILVSISRNFESNDTGLIYAIAIHPDYQNKGIGKNLINKLSENLKKRDITALYLHVKETNKGAIKFYNILGFIQVEFLKKFYSWGEGAYRMKLILSKNN